jgi:hypothetical protein
VLHESSYRLLMRLHVLNGDRAAALRIYHTCATVLQQVYQRLVHAPTAFPDFSAMGAEKSGSYAEPQPSAQVRAPRALPSAC